MRIETGRSVTSGRARRRRGLPTAAALVAAVTAVAVAGCGGSGSGGGSGGKAKLGLITQLSVADYFVNEAQGSKQEARKLGVQLQVADSRGDSAKVLELTRSMITSGVKALAIVPANTEIGPRVISMAKQAGIPLVASDSPLQSSDGKAAPFVGLDNVESGAQVGRILVHMFKQLGWSLDDTYYADVEVPLQACLQRTNAEVSTFRKAFPQFPASHVIKVPADQTTVKAQDSMRAAITAHPEAKHWLATSCSDDGVVGAVRALKAKSFPVQNVLGVGLGANMACQMWKEPYTEDAVRASTYLDPKAIGAGNVKLMYELAVQKKSVPPRTFVPTPEVNKRNYQQKLSCK